MSFWKSRRSFEASPRSLSSTNSSLSLQDAHSHHVDHSRPASLLPGVGWNNESSMSLPSYAEAIGARPNPSDIEARRQMLAGFLQEMQYDEELRLTEARKPPGLLNDTVHPQSNLDDQDSKVPDLAVSYHGDNLKVSPAWSTVERRRTLASIDEVSDLFPEPDQLGPKTSELYRRRPTSAPLRNDSTRKGHYDQQSTPMHIELDSNPVSKTIELPTQHVNSFRQSHFEYGNTRFNTLPGESFPLMNQCVVMESLLPLETSDSITMGSEHDTEHETFQSLLHPDFDPRTGLEITPSSIYHPRSLSKENLRVQSQPMY